jgi:hypothetical protein
MKYNQDFSGIAIADEIINRASSTAAALVHDTILDDSSIEIWTGAGGTGTQLAEGTDFELDDLDADLTAEAGSDIYLTLAIINGTYHSTDLYVSYKTVGDFNDSADINELQDIVGPSSLGVPFPRYEVSGLPAMPAQFAACSGQLVSDSESLYNGTRLPNLNGADVVLTLTFTANAGGATATVAAADRPAIALHDWVTGSGIAALTYVKSFNYATGALVISDPAASGIKSTTFANEGRGVIGGTAFGSVGDTVQSHWHEEMKARDSNNGVNNVFRIDGGLTQAEPAGGITFTIVNRGVRNLITDNINGTPRSGSKTKSDAYRMIYYMRIK